MTPAGQGEDTKMAGKVCSDVIEDMGRISQSGQEQQGLPLTTPIQIMKMGIIDCNYLASVR